MQKAPQRRWRTVLLALGASTGLASCLQDAPLDSLDPAGPAAQEIDDLSRIVFWMAIVIFVLVWGGIAYAIIRYRDQGQSEEPKQIHGNAKLEVVWTAIPILLLAGLAVPTVQSVFDLAECSPNSMEVDVIGHQWWFEYQYPGEDVTTANILVMPAGRQVCLNMTSEDVLHNYWIPRLNGKRYLVPGQQTELTLEADEPGEYWGQCGEFCGLSHALMRARVRALPEAEYQEWLQTQRQTATEPDAGTLAAEGKDLYLNGVCATCHVIDGVNELANPVGPDLTHFGDDYRTTFAGAAMDKTPENLAQWLADPPSIKPGSFMPNLNLSEHEIDALVAYLLTLDPTPED